MSDIFGSALLPSMKARQKRLCLETQKPRAKAVYEDENNFGAKLMSKMGWSEGKGLGVKEDGLTTPILPKYKKDNEGIGYAGEQDNHWTQHHHDFEGLLKSLNSSKTTSSNSNSGDEEISFKSLEEKSKNSRARVHYRKFTRGKDLTLASRKDIANIFGKKTMDEVKRAPPPVAIAKSVEKQVEEEEANEKTFGLVTVNTGKSVHDYFKEKLQALKRKHEETPTNIVVEDSLDCEPAKKKAKRAKSDDDGSLSEIVKNPVESVSKKKKRKNIETTLIEETENPKCESDHEKPSEVIPKRNKKKNKAKTDEQHISEIPTISETVEKKDADSSTEIPSESEEIVSKKKKRRNKEVVYKIEEQIIQENPILEESKKNKNQIKIVGTDLSENDDTKEKKKREVEEAVEKPESEGTNSDSSKKKKNKKRDFEKNIDETNDCPKETNIEIIEEIPEKAVSMNDSTEIELLALIKSQRKEKNEQKSELNLTEMGSLVLQQVDPLGFAGSNFSDIIGYGLTTNVKLVTQSDSQYQSDQILKLQYRKTSTSNQYQRKLRKKVDAFTSI